jgi:hypothetical protein
MKLKFATIRIALSRFVFGILSGIILNLALPNTIPGTVMNPYAKIQEFTILATSKSIASTCVQIIVLILILNFSYAILKQWKYGSYFKKKFKFIPISVGLSEYAFVPWIVGLIFGIVYGAGIMFQFAEKNEISHKDANLITIFLCLAHAIIEDSLLFWVIGGNFLYIFLIRLLLAIMVIKILSFNNLYKKIAWIGLRKSEKPIKI